IAVGTNPDNPGLGAALQHARQDGFHPESSAGYFALAIQARAAVRPTAQAAVAPLPADAPPATEKPPPPGEPPPAEKPGVLFITANPQGTALLRLAEERTTISQV